MDPVTVIVAALIAGATAGGEEAAASAVKDGYSALKAALKRVFGDDPAATVALSELPADPGTWERPLAKAVRDSGASGDAEILRLAEELLDLVEEAGGSTGDVTITASGERSVAAQKVTGNITTGDAVTGRRWWRTR